MSVIIRAVDAPASEWVYLDNVTNYTDRQTKRLTSNPIENKTVVSDHAIKEVRAFNVSGSISPWDFHLAGGVNRYISDGNVAIVQVGSIKVANTISDYLPSTISQYGDFSSDVKKAVITTFNPTVTKAAYLTSVYARIQALFDSDSLIDVHFADYKGRGEKLMSGVVMTSLVFSEDLNTGDSRRVDMSYKKPIIAYVRTEDVPAELADELAELESEGGVNGKTLTEDKEKSVLQGGIELFKSTFGVGS